MAYENRLIREIADYTETSLSTNLKSGQMGISSDNDNIVFKDAGGDFLKCATINKDASFLDVSVSNLTASEDISADNLTLEDYIYHAEDTTTYIRFQIGEINFATGSLNMLTLYKDEEGQSYVKINGSQTDVDIILSADSLTNSLFVQGSDGKVGINTGTPECQLDIFIASAGTVDPPSGTALKIESNDSVSLTFLIPNDKQHSINFGVPADNDAGQIVYYHTLGVMGFSCEGTTTLQLNSSGTVKINQPTELFCDNGNISIRQSSTTGNVATLTLDQKDIDKEFISFLGSTHGDTGVDLGYNLVKYVYEAFTETEACYAMAKVTDANSKITTANYYIKLYTLS